MDLICFDKRKGKHIKAGKCIDDVFYKTISRKRHYFRMIKGYAIESVVVDRLKDLNCKQIIIYERDTKDTLKIDFAEFIRKSRKYLQQTTIKEIYFRKEHYGKK